MKENYDGYKFSTKGKERIYNPSICIYFFNEYIKYKEIPRNLMDVNISGDYSKIDNILKLGKGENRIDIIEKTIAGEEIAIDIVQKFNPEIGFGEKELVSMLYYLGYLTIVGEEIGDPVLKVPNQVIKDLYAEYFLQILDEEIEFGVEINYNEIAKEILKEGKIEKITKLLEEYLKNLSNRDYQKFDEKYIKIMFYCIARSTKKFIVKSEMEIEKGYPDIVLIPKDKEKNYYSVMIEFKYLKKEEENKIEEKQKEAKEQIEKYSKTEEMKNIKDLKKYTIVAVNDKVYVKEV